LEGFKKLVLFVYREEEEEEEDSHSKCDKMLCASKDMLCAIKIIAEQKKAVLQAQAAFGLFDSDSDSEH